MPNQSRVLRCKYCNDTFQRNGHLQRHLLRHSGLKSFTCRVCTKSFSRNDTLLRHEAIHDQHDPQQNNNKGVVRACDPCVQAKQRCYGGYPCARCKRRCFVCEYKRQNSTSSVLQISNLPPSGCMSGDFAEQDTVISPSSIPTVPGSASALIESNSEPLITLPPNRLSVTTSLSDSLAREADGMSWPGFLPIPDPTSIEDSDIFPGYIPHDMRCANDMSRGFGFPFVWMTQSFESPSLTPDTLGQETSNLCIPDIGSLASLGDTGCASFMGWGPLSRPPAESGEARIREILDTNHTLSADVCPSFPMLQEDDMQSVGAELFGYVSKIPEKAYAALCAFYVSERGYDDMSFPHHRLLHAFVELYFEYFDPYLPFLHPRRVETDDLSWILFTAITAIGSQYSEVRDASRFTTVLQNLLRRATTNNNLESVANRPYISIVQSVLLRDVGLIFSGLISDQTVIQQERSMLMTLCRGLKTSTGFCDVEESTVDQDLNHRWLAWLQREEIVRLVHCVHVMECFQLVFFDLRPLFRVADFTQRLPCNDNLWRCDSARRWSEENKKGNPDSQTQRPGQFSTMSSILSLYADERAILDHLQSSRRLKSLIRSEPGIGLQEQDTYSARSKSLSLGASTDDLTFLDVLIDDAVMSKSLSHPEIENSRKEPMVHVIAILREIPLRMIYASLGWQTNGVEMQQSKERLKGYLQRNQSTARTCLWHAAQIYSLSRSLRYPVYFSSLSFTVASSYIFLYDQIMQCPAPQGQLLRLDKMTEKPSTDVWARCTQDFQAHITGIGILDNAESSLRLLSDAEKTLRDQKSWRSMAQALARCFSQMSKGQVPSID